MSGAGEAPSEFYTPLNHHNHPPKVGYDEFFRIEFPDILTGSGNTVKKTTSLHAKTSFT